MVPEDAMRIGIIGSGKVGRALAKGWAACGHEVVFGARHAAAPGPELGTGGVRAMPVADAARFGQVVVLATPFGAVREVLTSLGDLKDRVLIDCTNPLKPDLSGLDLEGYASGGERIASWAVGARVVKCFNSTGSANLAGPAYGHDALTMCLCGDDAEAKGQVARLAADLGFDPVDLGGIDASRLLEAFALLWIRLAHLQGLGPNIGWKLLRK